MPQHRTSVLFSLFVWPFVCRWKSWYKRSLCTASDILLGRNLPLAEVHCLWEMFSKVHSWRPILRKNAVVERSALSRKSLIKTIHHYLNNLYPDFDCGKGPRRSSATLWRRTWAGNNFKRFVCFLRSIRSSAQDTPRSTVLCTSVTMDGPVILLTHRQIHPLASGMSRYCWIMAQSKKPISKAFCDKNLICTI